MKINGRRRVRHFIDDSRLACIPCHLFVLYFNLSLLLLKIFLRVARLFLFSLIFEYSPIGQDEGFGRAHASLSALEQGLWSYHPERRVEGRWYTSELSQRTDVQHTVTGCLPDGCPELHTFGKILPNTRNRLIALFTFTT